tara:strand:- start:188 stop:598 length:411 start_codon:yes stop_codon:yes gene_type:complete
MPMCKGPKNEGNVIKGPWKRLNKNSEELQKARIIAECDEIASECMVSYLHVLVENDIAPSPEVIGGDESSISYVMFVSESIKAMIYNEAELEHPLQELFDLLVKKRALENDNQYFLDYHLLQKVLSTIKEEEKDPA